MRIRFSWQSVWSCVKKDKLRAYAPAHIADDRAYRANVFLLKTTDNKQTLISSDSLIRFFFPPQLQLSKRDSRMKTVSALFNGSLKLRPSFDMMIIKI